MRDSNCWLITDGREGSGDASEGKRLRPAATARKSAMTADERLTMQQELNAARDGQAAGSKAKLTQRPPTREALDSEGPLYRRWQGANNKGA
jgi:hypothetical protein